MGMLGTLEEPLEYGAKAYGSAVLEGTRGMGGPVLSPPGVEDSEFHPGLAALGEVATSMLIGPKSARARPHDLAEAKTRVAAGDDPNVVRQELGYFNPARKDWMEEIDDSQARLTIPERPAVIPMSRAQEKRNEGLRTQRSTMEDVYDNPLLYEHYPELRTMPVTFKMMNKDIGGQYNPDTKEIDLNLRDKDEDLNLSIIHETGHAIQDIEGFEQGASVKSARGIAVNNLMDEQRRLYRSGQLKSDEYKHNQKQLTELNAVGLDGQPMLSDWDVYQRIFGEGIARLGENRADMSPKDRWLVDPAKDLTVERQGRLMPMAAEDFFPSTPRPPGIFNSM